MNGDRKEVLLVDDVHLCRSFFAAGLRLDSGFSVCEASSPEEALKRAGEDCHDVILLNLTPRGYSGIALLQVLRRQLPEVGLLAFSYQKEDGLYAERAIHAGASGYISTDEPGPNLHKAIRAVASGGVYLNPKLRKKTGMAPGEELRGKESPLERLSLREFEVFCLTGQGHMPKRIAGMLQVSVKTIETYRERIRMKLGFQDGGELLYQAICFMQEKNLSNRCETRFTGLPNPGQLR